MSEKKAKAKPKRKNPLAARFPKELEAAMRGYALKTGTPINAIFRKSVALYLAAAGVEGVSYFVGNGRKSIPQNTPIKKNSPPKGGVFAGGTSEASPKPASCFGEGEEGAAFCFAPSAATRDTKSVPGEDLSFNQTKGT